MKYLLKQMVNIKKNDWDLAIQHYSKGPLQYKFLSNEAKIFTYLQSWLAYWNGCLVIVRIHYESKALLQWVINRPGVAGAVLQSPSSLTDSLTHPFVKISSKHSQSQTERARELKFSENVHPTICVMSQISLVMYHVSLGICHLSCVTSHM